MFRNALVTGAFGAGYLVLRRVLGRRPIFEGRFAERTHLIAWNATVVDCVQRLACVATEEEVTDMLGTLERIRETAQSSDRASPWTMQTLVASVSTDFARVAARDKKGATMEQAREQASLVEDVVPVMLETLQNIQYNHMIDTLGP